MELDKPRPEVREAVHAIDHGNGVFVDSDDSIGAEKWRIVLAELLRLARVDAELVTARETIKRLNRRVQVAEAGVAERVKVSAPGSLGRGLANAAADAFMHERDEARAELAALKARIAESAHVEVTLGCAIDGEIPPDLALCKVALVKMEK